MENPNESNSDTDSAIADNVQLVLYWMEILAVAEVLGHSDPYGGCLNGPWTSPPALDIPLDTPWVSCVQPPLNERLIYLCPLDRAMIRSAGYIRVSEEEQAKGHSPDFQMDFVRTTTKAMGWSLVTDKGVTFRGKSEEGDTIPGFFVDLGGHGWNINRPALRAMILAAKSKKFDTVVVWRQDRLSRTYEDISLILRALLKFGVTVYLDGKLYEAKDALIIGVRALVSEEELRKLKDGTKRGLAAAKGKGIRLARVPTGLRKTKDKTAFEPTELGIQICDSFESGQSYESLVALFGITLSKAIRVVRNVRAWRLGTLEEVLEEERAHMYERKEQMKARENADRKEFADWLRAMAGFEFE